MYKNCEQCGLEYKKNPKYSKTQWSMSTYCSQRCSGIVKYGVPRSEEVRMKLSKAHKGTKKPWAGKYQHSEEHNLKISKSVKEFYDSDKSNEVRRRISLSSAGRVISEETRANMRLAQSKLPTYKGGESTRLVRKAFAQRHREYVKKLNGGKHAFEEWEELKALYKYTCPACKKKEPSIKLTEDHIIPISKGGGNDISNIQPLCHSCNSKKHDKYIVYEP